LPLDHCCTTPGGRRAAPEARPGTAPACAITALPLPVQTFRWRLLWSFTCWCTAETALLSRLAPASCDTCLQCIGGTPSCCLHVSVLFSGLSPTCMHCTRPGTHSARDALHPPLPPAVARPGGPPGPSAGPAQGGSIPAGPSVPAGGGPHAGLSAAASSTKLAAVHKRHMRATAFPRDSNNPAGGSAAAVLLPSCCSDTWA
jgi:hypothetical protein